MSLKEETLHSLKNNNCRIKPSLIGGVGVLAIRDIKKGAELFIGARNKKLCRIKPSELKGVDKETMDMIKGFFVRDSKGYYLIPEGGLDDINIAFFMNHSNKPNVVSDQGDSFFAARKIKKGEELTVDYATFDESFDPKDL